MISVVIPTYRKPDLLAHTLDGLRNQQPLPPQGWEIVVVDDGSEDGTQEVLRERGIELPLRVVAPASNEGRAKARNRGWRAARGEWVLFLDDDIVLEPAAVSAHAAAQRRRPAVYLGEVVTAPEIADSSLFDYLDTRGIGKHLPGDRVPARYLLTQNVSLPRAALEAVDGFDEDFGAYGFEDMEIAFRLEDAVRLEFYFLDHARGRHIHHHSLDEYLAKKELCGRRTLPRIAELHPGRVDEMQMDLLLAPLEQLEGERRRLAWALRRSFDWGGPGLARALIRRWPRDHARRALFRLYDYLVLSAYAQGIGQGDTDNLT